MCGEVQLSGSARYTATCFVLPSFFFFFFFPVIRDDNLQRGLLFFLLSFPTVLEEGNVILFLTLEVSCDSYSAVPGFNLQLNQPKRFVEVGSLFLFKKIFISYFLFSNYNFLVLYFVFYILCYFNCFIVYILRGVYFFLIVLKFRMYFKYFQIFLKLYPNVSETLCRESSKLYKQFLHVNAKL